MELELARRPALAPRSKPQVMVEADIYRGFDPVSRAVLRNWKDAVTRVVAEPLTDGALAALNAQLLTGNAVTLIDHHYAFDALPLALALAQKLTQAEGVIIPYAAHLEMRLDPHGYASRRYQMRTWAFRRLVRGIRKGAPGIEFHPIAREFELANPRLKAVVDRDFDNANTRYLKALVRMFTSHRAGQLCFMAPMAGLALPGRALLNSQLYRSLELVQSRSAGLPFFFIGAYPRWNVTRNYFAPLLARHDVVARGPFALPGKDYEAALAVIGEELAALRGQARFVLPDYSRIKHK